MSDSVRRPRPSRPARLLAVLVPLALYPVLFLLFRRLGGPGVAALSSLPVLAAALFFGLRAGLAASGTMTLVNLALFSATGAGGGLRGQWGGLVFGTLASTAMAVVVARIRELTVGLRREVAARRRAEEHKRELTSLIVHDLKSPLAGVIASCQFIEEVAGDLPEAQEAAKDALAGARTLLRLVMNVLDVNRSEDGALVPRPEPIALPALLEEVARGARHRAGLEGKQVAVESAGDDLNVHADRDLVRRVLENLVDNALKYQDGPGTIALAARRQDDAVELQVRDHGGGVPPEWRERIFEKYVRLGGDNDAQRYVSRGLGLSFCRAAVEAHGGRVWVEPNEPKGSIFCVRLPVGKLPPPAAAA